MRYLILGGTGFIGKNLIIGLLEDYENEIVCFSRYATSDDLTFQLKYNSRIKFIYGDFNNFDFSIILKNIDIVVHLISTTRPSNTQAILDFTDNVLPTIKFLDLCVKIDINKLIFVSSGGTVYGKTDEKQITENHTTNPISSYGIQKLTIEKLIYLYYHLHNLDYRIIRLSNPYGPFQDPNSGLGAITSFLYRALNEKPIFIYGDGKIIRDYLYIDDAIKGIINIINYKGEYKLFNLGSGIKTSLNDILNIIGTITEKKLDVTYCDSRIIDVPYNVLDNSRYKSIKRDHIFFSLEEGIKKYYEFINSKRNDSDVLG